MINPLNSPSSFTAASHKATSLTSTRLLPKEWAALPIAKIAALAPVQRLEVGDYGGKPFTLAIKREDQLCPHLGGNKIYKLYHHLQRAQTLGAKRLVSFGGAYSNHLYALAFAGKELGLTTVAVIRGERPAVLGSTLHELDELGMELKFVSRSAYRNKHLAAQWPAWGIEGGTDYVIPEGGGGLRGALGMAHYWQAARHVLPAQEQQNFSTSHGAYYDHIVIAAGTGASAAGIIAAEPQATVHVVSVLKGSARLTQAFEQQIASLQKGLGRYSQHYSPRLSPHFSQHYSGPRSWRFYSNYHCGGYGPVKPEYMAGLRRCIPQANLPLDKVYTAKAMLALLDLMHRGVISPAERVLLLHTGGLQGGKV